MHLFHKSNQKRVVVTLKNMKLIDVPPHGTPIFVKAKQRKIEKKSESVSIHNNTAFWSQPLSIKVYIAKSKTDKHTPPLRLSFRFEDASGKSFTRYGIAEIDCTTAYFMKTSTCEMLLSNCNYNTKLKCSIEIHLADIPSVTPNVDAEAAIVSDFNSQSDYSSQSGTTTALVTNAATGGTTVTITTPKKDYEFAPVKISEKRYLELEAQVVDLLSTIIIDSADAQKVT